MDAYDADRAVPRSAIEEDIEWGWPLVTVEDKPEPGDEVPLEAFAAERRRLRKPRCTICALPPRLRKQVEGRTTATHADVVAWLRTLGYRIQQSGVSRHLAKHGKETA